MHGTGYPERVLIYHAGTGKNVYIACLKVSTIFLFVFYSVVEAPSFYNHPDEPHWKAALGLS